MVSNGDGVVEEGEIHAEGNRVQALNSNRDVRTIHFTIHQRDYLAASAAKVGRKAA